MTTYLTLVIHLIFAFIVHLVAQSPPMLQPDAGISQKIVTPGVTVTIPCPVSGNRNQMLFEWYKDKESIISFGGQRIRVTGSGALRIKKSAIEDTGIYTCRAVNGFGSMEYNTTLVVLDDKADEDYEDSDYQVNNADEDSLEDSELSSPSAIAKPHLLHVTYWDPTNSHKPLGSSLQLYCVATGLPRPRITWTKDGGELPSGVAKRGRWSLSLQNLQLSHSGNYTCTASNHVGSASHSFFIDVITSGLRSGGKPEMVGIHPSNTTVEEGNVAVLQCVVRSLLHPHIEWLKRVESDEMQDENFRDVIQVGDENFRVIKSSDIMDRADGSYFNKLVIRQTTVKDSGKYICLGANSNGYNYRSAFLYVLSLSRSLGVSPAESLPFPIVVAVIVLGVAAVAGFVAVMVYCRSRHGVNSSSIASSTTAVPMVPKDNCMHHHQRSGSPKTCGAVIYEPRSGSRGHQNVTVYVPSCQGKYGH